MAWTKPGVLSGAKLLVLGNLRADVGLGVTILDGVCQLCPRGDTLRWTKLTVLGVEGLEVRDRQVGARSAGQRRR